MMATQMLAALVMPIVQQQAVVQLAVMVRSVRNLNLATTVTPTNAALVI